MDSVSLAGQLDNRFLGKVKSVCWAIRHVPETISRRGGNLLARGEASGDSIRHGVAHEDPPHR
jgi:hypothetical protein